MKEEISCLPLTYSCTHTTHICEGGGRAKERMGEAGRERQSHLWRVEGSGGKKEGGKIEDGVEKEKAGKEVRQGMHRG